MAEDITNETSHEEIQAFVDTLAEERAGDKAETAKPDKTDAQITNNNADNFRTEETSAVKDDDETDDATEGAVETDDDRSWLDDDLKSEVAAYGIGEDELADFTSREELDRALRLFDKSALEAGRKALAEGEESNGPGRDDKGRFTKGDSEAATEKKSGAGYEVTLDKNVYDDEIVDEFARMRDHYESRLDALESRLLEVDAKAEEQHFDSLVDSLGHTDLFGKTGKENGKQLQRRQDLHVALKAQMIGLQELGRPTEMSESLINRVARMVFAEELGKKELKSRTSRISKQSNGRQGGSVTRPQEPRETPREWADQLYKELTGA